MTMTERCDRLDAMIAENRLVRERWTDGQDRACLLAALSPESGNAGKACMCPAAVMAPWLAHLTPWIDDSGSLELWPSVVRRYAAVARRWAEWTDATWERKNYSIRALIVREAARHTTDARALSACSRVIALCDSRAGGQETREEDWAAARAAARAAAASAASASAAAEAAVAASAAAAEAAAARAAAWAAWASAARASAEASARIKSADAIIEGILSVLEAS
jgi:hypothetical protein